MISHAPRFRERGAGARGLRRAAQGAFPPGVCSTSVGRGVASTPLQNLQQEMRALPHRLPGPGHRLRADLRGDNDMVGMPPGWASWAAPAYTEIGPSDLYFVDINDTSPGADLWNSNGNTIWGEVPFPYQSPQPAGYDQVDYHPDLWVGGASVSTADEAQTFLNKVFLYEGIGRTDYFETGPERLRIGYSTGILWYSPYIPERRQRRVDLHSS
ncbi:MAG: C25 family cysteine peptidase [Candidatus Moduliflexus flocculans]|nr:C25 family cysteine peptidase [Candidatus Moduliflexus flocculans]